METTLTNSIVYLGEVRTVYPRSREDDKQDLDSFFGRGKPSLMTDFWKDFQETESPMGSLVSKSPKEQATGKTVDAAKFDAYGQPLTSVWIPCSAQPEQPSPPSPPSPTQVGKVPAKEALVETVIDHVPPEGPEIDFGSLDVQFDDDVDDQLPLSDRNSTGSQGSSGTVSDLYLSSSPDRTGSHTLQRIPPVVTASVSQCSTISLSAYVAKEPAQEEPAEEGPPMRRTSTRRSCRSLYKTEPPAAASPPKRTTLVSGKRKRALSEEWTSGRAEVEAAKLKERRTVRATLPSHTGPCSSKCVVKKEDTLTQKKEIFADRPSSKKKFLLCADISEGKELFPVRVWNDVNDQKLPKFKYVCGLIDEAEYQRKPCVCQCRDFCNARCFCMNEPFEVAKCDVAYDAKTKLLRNPSGWVNSIIPNIPRTIWECSAACPCGPQCSNRSAQLGLRYPFDIFMTETKGWGVRTVRGLPAGAFVAEYAGKVRMDDAMSYWTEATWYTFSLISGPIKGQPKSKKEYFLDASKRGNLTRFINHGCVPNCVAINVFWDDTDPKRGMHVGIYTVRKISAGQELTLDYSASFWRAKAEAGEYCQCGSRKCQYAKPKRDKRKKKQQGLSKKKKAA
ncbi:hypothetical protein RvY_13915-2 [Ramazzottius varieornatus]|uniref:SET domain-containing protein n=1 Tax=Ramazzottius varieornatus TaxID=947166 RepID=A0A1D1VRN0_RAMVA|nr:hypothetical protein RvY_13915-2 [Ramazzottius varieornatus]